MKKNSGYFLHTGIFLPAIVAVMLMLSCHRQPSAVISGSLAGYQGKMVYLDRLDIDRALPQDSVKAGRNGRFRFRVAVEEPVFFLLKVSPSNFITLLIQPGEKLHVESDSAFLPASYRVTGSEGSLLVKQLDDHLRETMHKTDSIKKIYRANMGKPGFDTLSVQLNKAYSDLIEAQHKYNIAFILRHLHSPATLKALYQKYDDNTYLLSGLKDLQYMKIVADTLKVYYPDSKMTRALMQDLKKEMSKYNELRLQSMIRQAGKVNLDVALPDMQGDTLTLSSFWKKGNYVLLTFWASWCQQCITENLSFKGLYRKYHGKGLEIYAVSLDKNKDAWIKEVRFDELPWINVWDPAGESARRFNVTMPPVNFLFAPDGTVLARDLHGRALQIKLSQLFD